MPFTAPPSPDYSANGIVNPGTANEFAFYSTATEVDSTDKLIIRGDFQLGINVDLFAAGQTSFKTVEGSFQVLNDDESELRASLSLESQVLGGSLDLFNGSEEQVIKIHNDGSGNASIECKADKSIEFGRSAGTPPLVVSDVVHLATLTAVVAGDVGMASDGRPTAVVATRGFAQGYGTALRKIATVSDVADGLVDTVSTIATATATVITSVGVATGAMLMFEVIAAVKFADETAFCNIFRRGSVVNNAGTLTVALGTAVNTSGGAGAANIDGDTVDAVVNGTNLDFRLDPETATARNYRYILKVWELA